MKDDVLTVVFDNGLEDESGLCVTRKCGEKFTILKMELGEQADILYHLLTNQMAKAEIKSESEELTIKPQQKIGRWIDDKCSICGKGIEDLIESYEWYRAEDPNFCPFCGVKLQAENEL